MTRFHAEYILYVLLLLSICITVGFFSRSMPYTIPTTKDKLVIVYNNVDYLTELVLRLDHMLEIIYFGFLAALCFLGFCYGRTQRKVAGLEAKAEEWIKATKAISAFGVSSEIQIEHPAYGQFSKELANETGLDSVVRDLVLREIERHAVVHRVEALEREVEQLRGMGGGKKEQSKMAPPAYRQDGQNANVGVSSP